MSFKNWKSELWLACVTEHILVMLYIVLLTFPSESRNATVFGYDERIHKPQVILT